MWYRPQTKASMIEHAASTSHASLPPSVGGSEGCDPCSDTLGLSVMVWTAWESPTGFEDATLGWAVWAILLQVFIDAVSRETCERTNMVLWVHDSVFSNSLTETNRLGTAYWGGSFLCADAILESTPLAWGDRCKDCGTVLTPESACWSSLIAT